MSVALSPKTLELLASKICHDLVSPVGAVANGVEFLEDIEDGVDPDVVGLIQHSASQASAKLKIFRMAYGMGGADSNIKPEEVFEAVNDWVSGDGKVTQEWDPHAPLGPEERPAGFCKTLISLLMLAVDCMPRGGTIKVEGQGDNVVVIATGEGVKFKPLVDEAYRLELHESELEPPHIHAFLTATLAQQYGFRLSIESQSDSEIRLLFAVS